jgi:hypothetical protein
MNISCSTISPECVVGTTVNIYAILTSSGKTLYPIDKYLIEEIYINSIDNWQTLLQEAFQSAIVNYPTPKYTIGVQIVDGCGQYGNFVISDKIKDAEAIVLTATPSSTVPKYDWSAEVRLNTVFLSGDVLTIDLTGIPSTFTLNSISSITPATSAISVVGQTLAFSGNVAAGTYFVISGTFDDNLCTAGTATLTIAGDTITANNVVTGTYSGATWCVPPVPPTTTINPTVATLIAPNNNDGGCVGGFISETVTITGGGLNVPVSSFPADLCALLSGLPVTLGTKLLTITSDVATACGTATHAIGITVSEVGGFITQINGTSCTPPPLKDTLVDTDNNANGFGCNAGNLVYPFSIDLTVRGGSIVAVTNDADIIAAYAALPIPIAVTISGCDILLPLGETPTDIEIACIRVVLYSDGVSLPASAITNTATDFIVVPNIVTAGTVGGGTVTGQVAVYDEFGAVVYALQPVTLGVANTLGATLADGFYYLHVFIVNSYGNTIEFYKKIYIKGLTDIGEGYNANLSIVGNDAVYTYANSTVLDAGGSIVNDPTQGSYEVLYDAAVLVPPTTPISGFTVVNPTVGSHMVDIRWWFGGVAKPAMVSYKTSNIIVGCQS